MPILSSSAKSSEYHAEFEHYRLRSSPLLLKKELILEDYISDNAVRKESSKYHAEFGLTPYILIDLSSYARYR
jgi:hypothetical protein